MNNKILDNLKERAKELNCLYQIEEVLKSNLSIEQIIEQLLKIIPQGWRYPEICEVMIKYNNQIFKTPNWVETEWKQNATIFLQKKAIGSITVCYSKYPPDSDKGIFLKEEYKLLSTIADRLSDIIYYKKYENIINKIEPQDLENLKKPKYEWEVILELLMKTDQNLFIQLSRKMISYLYTMGIDQVEDLIQIFGIGQFSNQCELYDTINKPGQKTPFKNIVDLSFKVFRFASNYLNEKEIVSLIHKWIQAYKTSNLARVLSNLNSSLHEIVEALIHYKANFPEDIELLPSTENSLRVCLLERFFFDQLEAIRIAKNHISVNDYYELVTKIIASPNSHGKLGGKSAGLFLASRIIKNFSNQYPILKDIKIPKTWYISSDTVNIFLEYNNLEDIIAQKYKPIEQIRVEYNQIIKLFKNSNFPPDIVKGLSMALDDFGDNPLIVRSSSLLEDRFGTAFSGKYKSLFLANQGTKAEKLAALMDAIAEVYASIFSPDPIEYRANHDLLDFHEEMGIMIQEVVGTKVGKYYFPHCAGVAFSYNEFRWSPRIQREDGLIRLVPGLGTRAVDRLGDDFPILLSPGQPNLRINSTIEEIIRYSPQYMDVINLETNSFETIKISDFLKEHGEEFEGVHKIVSLVRDKHITSVSPFNIDFNDNNLVVTFNGIIEQTNLINKIGTMLKVLQENLLTPVDIEFAYDGKDLYLLQCRPQAQSSKNVAATIPKDIPKENIIFTAEKFVSNGLVPDITHIVYVDPFSYSKLENLKDLIEVGKVVSKLNKILPKRQFILMGPGRWGSRGDIKLGVKVTYSDFNNTAMLIEIARKKGNYIPELSFGTHFFLDLVESSIRYLPLYPDDEGIIFNEEFLSVQNSILLELLPEYSHLADTIRVIDVPKVTDGKILKILMNADENKAIGYLACPETSKYECTDKSIIDTRNTNNEDIYWKWRLRIVEKIGEHLKLDEFGVKGLYLIGSTKNATAGPASDIDLVVHFDGTESQKEKLLAWLEGWSLCLDEINFEKTGFKTGGLLDVHIVTDKEINEKTSFAVKLTSITNGARAIVVKS